MSTFDPASLLGWTADRLAEGMSLAHEALGAVTTDGFQIELLSAGVVPPGADLRWGVGLPAPWPALVDRIVDVEPEGQLFVELPLRRPGDAPDEQLARVVVLGHELYACAPTTDRSAVVTALRAHDPATLYVAAVIHTQDESVATENPVDALRAGIATIDMVIVSALDGESFVLCTRA